uniref:Uncharacterized protein n=1 Tax=Chromera velia CCMP2878 TaxID=1169474 RepID=A0A0G4H8T6_9ALVE|eukprot:Cvel_25220.t1-p1 / transcript=Cvel_25220.t1 / gene=Cvel_25220 / organism=Chromera_velia_CCMP2878 / gene_product=hypothetical protein / transcript_product=hypothetical protein / location=Cvel_scaffold2827:21775-21984(-) / protein_length=70 / sequence_SO=supercontig / SO=protein_coding / is_pseudo=false
METVKSPLARLPPESEGNARAAFAFPPSPASDGEEEDEGRDPSPPDLLERRREADLCTAISAISADLTFW